MFKLRLHAVSGLVSAAMGLSLLIASSTADAQNLPGGGSRGGAPTGPVVGGAPAGRAPAKEAAPAAIPGATARTDAAPSDRAPTDMQPTEALFDAINRGDIGAARDALNRGADFTERNVLGMTPTELSVDLGRNDITFLLLSMRGSGPADEPSAAAGARTTTATRNAARPGPKGRPAAIQASNDDDAAPAPPTARATRAGQNRFGANTAPAAPRQAPPPVTARQFAGDGGAPIPQAGFLGFGNATR